MTRKRLIVGFLLLICVGIFSTSMPGNLFWMLEGYDSYFVPAESSIWTFEPDVLNPGSGSWWLYGSDPERFYALSMTKPEYYFISRENGCADFNPKNFETWCEYRTSPVPMR